jgi:hypothetical protein
VGWRWGGWQKLAGNCHKLQLPTNARCMLLCPTTFTRCALLPPLLLLLLPPPAVPEHAPG